MYKYNQITGSSDRAATMDQPLFGETRRRDKLINIVLAAVTAVFVVITIILALLSTVFVKKKCKRIQNTDHYCVYPLDIVLCVIIILLLVPQIIVAYWYRRGELEPKFRTLIYYNAVVTVLLCLCGILYFMQVGYH